MRTSFTGMVRVMKKISRAAAAASVALMLALFACSSTKEPAQAARRVGADRDAHGCIGSAGYSWCAKENSCVRPWELAKSKGFEVSQTNFTRYCTAGVQ